MVGSLPLNTDRFFQGGWDYEALLAANPRLTEVRFNQPDQFQEPRQVRFNLTLQF
jgi:hypothetical protein